MDKEKIRKTSDLKLQDVQDEGGDSEKTYHRQRNRIMNLHEQLDESRDVLDSYCQDLKKRWMDIEYFKSSIEESHILMRELWSQNHHLELQLEKAVMVGEHHDKPKDEELETVPHSCVELSDVEDEQMAQAAEEEKAQVVDVQTKSWWRRQAMKMRKGMTTFRLRLKRCLGLKTSEKTVARVINVQEVNSSMDIAMPPVSVGMPPVSI